MSYIKMGGDNSKYQGKLEIMGKHLIKVSGLVKNTNGFKLYLDNDELIGDYSKYTHIYENPDLGENVYEYTDNGMSYEDREKEAKEKKEKDKIKHIVDDMYLIKFNEIQAQLSELQENLISIYESIIEVPNEEEEKEEESEVIENDNTNEING